MLKIERLLSYFLIPTFFFLFHLFLDLVFNIYDKFPWFANVMHFSGGLMLGITFSLILNYLNEEKYLEMNRLMRIIFVFSLVSMTAIFWEFYEFVLVAFFDVDWQITYFDTIRDLFVGMIGGFLGSLIFVGKK